MYPFSRVQRNISHQKTLIHFAGLAGFALFYPAIASLYPLLPPLLGVVYVKWREAWLRSDYVETALWMLYAIVFESVWGLPLYGLWSAMFAFFALFDPKITYFLRNRLMIDLVSVVLFDLFYVGMLWLYGAIIHQSVVSYDSILIYYMLMDVVGVVLL